MPINAAIANQLIHQILIEEDRGGIFHINIAKRKRVILSKGSILDDEFVCWWALINQPTSTRTIQLKALGESIMKLGTMSVSLPAFGMGSLVEAAGDGGDMKSLDRMAAGINAQLQGAWDAGVWSAAKDTPMEFTIGLKHFLIGGAAAIKKVDNVAQVRLAVYHSKNDVISFMSYAEKSGDVAEYTRKICHQREYHLEATSGKLKKVA